VSTVINFKDEEVQLTVTTYGKYVSTNQESHSDLLKCVDSYK